uniref:Exonuclease domain-containing protein n=1 Tax=Magallana gigas TaxID=29159 RepID=A0A8W8MVE1_MAGGI
MKRRKEVQEKIQLPSTKLRRLVLKQERAVTQGAQEALEGDSYQSGIGHNEHPDIEKLPDPVVPGCFKPVTLPSAEEPTLVMFDLETTDFIRGRQMPHIVQIAAVELKSEATFNTYVRPKMPQTENARLKTGIVANSSGVSVAGKSVKSDNIHSAADKFIRYLTKFKNVCLIAHNGRSFDFPVLVSTFKNIQKDTQLSSVVTGCVDSLAMFKKCFENQDSYKQERLYRSLFNETYGAHNAVDDVKALWKLVQHALLSQIDTLSFTFPLKAVIQQLIYNGEKARNYNSLATLVQNAVLSECMARKIAGSGLTLGHLKAIKNRDGEDGLRNAFLVKTEGQSRVSCTKKTLDDVVSKLMSAL